MRNRKHASDAESVKFAFRLPDGRDVTFALLHLPGTPARNALGDACGDRWNRLLGLLAKLQARPKVQAPQAWKQVASLAKEFCELAGWAFASSPGASGEGAVRIARLVEKHGRAQLDPEARSRTRSGRPAPPVKVVRLSETFLGAVPRIVADTDLPLLPGRPTTLRAAAIEAFELRLQDIKRWTWSSLAGKLCPCVAPKHDFRCQQNLRREVLHLKNVLAKFKIDLSSKVE